MWKGDRRLTLKVKSCDSGVFQAAIFRWRPSHDREVAEDSRTLLGQVAYTA